ncbi:MAG: recombination regulator RecX, partial [Defluviitaleaceae bacterium]|nr:recombination regulator RecX [Defluviitaleaceae bacterium]
MTITDIKPQVKNPKRYSVFIDGDFAFGIDGTELLYQRLEVGQTLHQSTYEKLLHQLEYTSARDTAVRYLSRNMRSVQQVRDKLTEKEFSTINIEKVIGLLSQRGYLNDIAFATAFISQKTKLNNFGRWRIEQELRAKGVGQKSIDAAYSQTFADDEDGECQGIAAARRALAKKLRNKDTSQIANDPKEINRLKMFLSRRGFDFDTIDFCLS